MVRALQDLPNMAAQAQKCQLLLAHFRKTLPEPKTTAPPSTKARFAEPEPTPPTPASFAPEEPKNSDSPKNDDDRDKPIEFSPF
jgi:hypothetical protein